MDLLEKLRTMVTDKSQKGRLRLLVLMAGGLLAAGVVLATLRALWVPGQAPVRGAIVSGAFTLLAAIAGVFIVLLQLRRQAKNTIAANRHNEMMKLKKDVYGEAQPALHAAKAAHRTFNWCIKRLLIDIENVRKLPQWMPQTSLPVLSEDMQLSHDATHAAISLTEKWRINAHAFVFLQRPPAAPESRPRLTGRGQLVCCPPFETAAARPPQGEVGCGALPA